MAQHQDSKSYVYWASTRIEQRYLCVSFSGIYLDTSGFVPYWVITFAFIQIRLEASLSEKTKRNTIWIRRSADFSSRSLFSRCRCCAFGVWHYKWSRRSPHWCAHTSFRYFSGKGSFKSISEWHQNFTQEHRDDTRLVLIGNKTDLVEERAIDHKKAQVRPEKC